MGFYDPPGTKYDQLNYLNNVSAYTPNPSTVALLDQAREILSVGEYFWLGVPFPPAMSTRIAARQTFSGIITVPSLAYVVALSGDTVYFDEAHPMVGDDGAGFMLRIYDKGAKMDSIINAQFIRGSLVTGNMKPTGTEGQKGPYWLLDPFVLLRPGSLQLEITNQSATQDKDIQILMGLAVPASPAAVGQVLVEGTRTPIAEYS